jgi:hypothetical protein
MLLLREETRMLDQGGVELLFRRQIIFDIRGMVDPRLDDISFIPRMVLVLVKLALVFIGFVGICKDPASMLDGVFCHIRLGAGSLILGFMDRLILNSNFYVLGWDRGLG